LAFNSFPDKIQGFNCVAQMRNHDAATYYQTHVESFDHLGIASSSFHALEDLIIDAIVATQHHVCYQTEQFFGLRRQGTILVSCLIEVELSVNSQVMQIFYPQIHPFAV
jgi:hypothetical protein